MSWATPGTVTESEPLVNNNRIDTNSRPTGHLITPDNRIEPQKQRHGVSNIRTSTHFPRIFPAFVVVSVNHNVMFLRLCGLGRISEGAMCSFKISEFSHLKTTMDDVADKNLVYLYEG